MTRVQYERKRLCYLWVTCWGNTFKPQLIQKGTGWVIKRLSLLGDKMHLLHQTSGLVGRRLNNHHLLFQTILSECPFHIRVAFKHPKEENDKVHFPFEVVGQVRSHVAVLFFEHHLHSSELQEHPCREQHCQPWPQSESKIPPALISVVPVTKAGSPSRSPEH